MLKNTILVFLLLAIVKFSNAYCSASRTPIDGLEPQTLWESFYNISCIPRCSEKEAQVRDQIVINFARSRGYSYKIDAKGNALILVPATLGKEKTPTVVIQTHMDMVCEKNGGIDHDFDKDPIQLRKSGDWIDADGTTLGSDDAMGMAHVMALLRDETAIHGPLEVLFTVEEEIGLLGAHALQPGFVTGQYLINIDDVTQGQVTVGCSGGQTTHSTFPNVLRNDNLGREAYRFKIFGGAGGHSGVDIDKKRSNSIKLMGQFLNKLRNSNIDFGISEISAGDKTNAIPRESIVNLSINPRSETALRNLAAEFLEELKLEYSVSDPLLTYEIVKIGRVRRILNEDTTRKLINVLMVYPNGPMAMSSTIPGLVETSLNIGTIRIFSNSAGANLIEIGSSVRSSFNTAKLQLVDRIKSLFNLVPRSQVAISGDYPAWEPKEGSELVEKSRSAYTRLFNKDVRVTMIHGGLETAIIGNIYPWLDMISMGATTENAHSPDERVSISSVLPSYQFLVGLLEEITK